MKREAAYIAGGCILILVLITLMASIVVMPVGSIGVVSTFQTLDDDVLQSGAYLIAPWRDVRRMSIRTEELSEKAETPTKEGLAVMLDVTLQYHLDASKAVDVYRMFGIEYHEKLVHAVFRSALRNATTHYEAKDLYTASRDQIETEITRTVSESLSPRGIIVERVLLKNVSMPPMVRERIEAKLAADQDAQRMEFVLRKEQQEAERKRVEAKGIADSQQIIKKDLDDNYLKYLWIQALSTAAEHKNQIIYVPTGSDGMPIFKGVK
jgi:regulator of protease activity HflC (stomatin/prohibitin superfamily)